MNYYFEVLKKYAVFNGRARRKEYWMFCLFNVIIGFTLGFIDGIIGAATESRLGVLGILYGLAVLIPSIAVTIRRLHDTNRSGWWFCISFIPIVGGVVLIIFLALDSQPGENKYGQNPKEIKAG